MNLTDTPVIVALLLTGFLIGAGLITLGLALCRMSAQADRDFAKWSAGEPFGEEEERSAS